MSVLDDTYCQVCERLITEEQWKKHLFSTRHLHREVNGFLLAHFAQKKLT